MVTIRFILTVAETERMKYARNRSQPNSNSFVVALHPKSKLGTRQLAAYDARIIIHVIPNRHSAYIYIDSFLMGQRQRTCMD
jgi:hypothetical protein